VSLIKNKKTPGTDKLKGNIFKRLHPTITPLLGKILNACFNFSNFPKRWKKEKLVILLKDPKVSHTNIKKYRPITLLPEHGKIMEKITRKAVEAELTPLHSRHQYGFTKGRSTTDALESLVSTVRNAYEKYVANIYFDIRGVFDNLW
jgi:retron-type reverse transcriptase